MLTFTGIFRCPGWVFRELVSSLALGSTWCFRTGTNLKLTTDPFRFENPTVKTNNCGFFSEQERGSRLGQNHTRVFSWTEHLISVHLSSDPCVSAPRRGARR